MRDVADDYHVTIWLGDLNYRYQAVFTPDIPILPCMCTFKHYLGPAHYVYSSNRLLQTNDQVHKKAA